MVTSERTVGATVQRETRYFIAHVAAAKAVGQAVRWQWGIENRLHWVLDIAFREDECRVREGHSAQNLAVLRHIALNLLRQDQTVKVGIKAKRLKAGRDDQYVRRILLYINQ
jgi:predicted transposase YbfD/YdcC